MTASQAPRHPELVRVLELDDPDLREHELIRICQQATLRYRRSRSGTRGDDVDPFRFWSIYDREGHTLAISLTGLFTGQFAGRDYFLGARALGEAGRRQAYLSSVFIGTATREFEFALSAPIFDAERRWRGVIVASVLTTAELNTVPLDDRRYTAVLAGPEDPSSGPLQPPIAVPSSRPDPPRYRIFRHPRLGRGASVTFDDAQVRRIAARVQRDHVERWQQPLAGAGSGESLNDYEDPLGKSYPEYAGRRLAAFAPVGQTGYVFIVQANERDVLGSEKRFALQLAGAAALSTLPGILFVLSAATQRSWRWRGPRQRRTPAR